MTIKEKLIKNGIRNLKEFGYPEVNEQNILTDEVYSQFFLRMLEDNKDHSADLDKEIQLLIDEIKR